MLKKNNIQNELFTGIAELSCPSGLEDPSYWKAGKCIEMNQIFAVVLIFKEFDV